MVPALLPAASEMGAIVVDAVLTTPLRELVKIVCLERFSGLTEGSLTTTAFFDLPRGMPLAPSVDDDHPRVLVVTLLRIRRQPKQVQTSPMGRRAKYNTQEERDEARQRRRTRREQSTEYVSSIYME